MDGWNDFYVATAGSAAALAGLLFVGISINLKILSNPTLPVRASVSLVLLLSILIFSMLFLIPRQTKNLLGYEIIIVGLIVYVIITRADLKIYNQTPGKYKIHSLFYLLFDQLATLPYIIGGLCILLYGVIGFYLIVPAIILSFIKSVLEAWVLLIEINR